MGDAGVAHAREMAGGCLLAVEVPNRLGRVGVVVGEKTSGVGPGKDPCVSPALARHWATLLGDRSQVEDVDDQEVAGLRALDADRPAQHVGDGEVDIPNVIGRIVVADLAVGPLSALDSELVARLDHRGDGDIGVPPVVAWRNLVPHGLRLVHGEDHVRHGASLVRVWFREKGAEAGGWAWPRSGRPAWWSPDSCGRRPAPTRWPPRVAGPGGLPPGASESGRAGSRAAAPVSRSAHRGRMARPHPWDGEW